MENKAIWSAITAAGNIHGVNMQAYLTYISIRLIEIYRILKRTGSIYLHCDPTASHYLKLVLDSIFGQDNFKNEIIWKRTGMNYRAATRFSRIHDCLLFYTKSKNCSTWNPQDEKYGDDSIKNEFRFNDDHGQHGIGKPLMRTNKGTSKGEAIQPWNDIDPTKTGRIWNVPYTTPYAKYIEDHFIPGYRKITSIHDRLDALAKADLIYYPPKGTVPGLKRYLAAGAPSRPPQDIITNIKRINNSSKEQTSYPTQKPVALLELLIKSSSNEGDIILDPFCGTGTTCVAAEKLNRQWIGIDVAEKAEDIILERLNKEIWNWALLNNNGVRPNMICKKNPPKRTDINSPIRSFNIKQILYKKQQERCAAPCEDGKETGRQLPIDLFEVDHTIPNTCLLYTSPSPRD